MDGIRRDAYDKLRPRHPVESEPMEFQLLRLAGHPVIALPRDLKRRKLAALARVNAFTLKRWTFVQAMRAAVCTGTDRLFMEVIRQPIDCLSGFDFEEFLAVLSERVDTKIGFASIVWPWPPQDYRGRVYVHVFDETGRAVVFCKLSLEKKQNENLENEARLLKAVIPNQTLKTKVPEIIHDGSFRDLQYLAMEPIPPGFRPAPNQYPLLMSLIRDLCSSDWLTSSDIYNAEWWYRVLELSSVYPVQFNHLVDFIENNDIAASIVHGDFSSKNVVEYKNAFYVLDWEMGSLRGPRLVDHVSCALSIARTPQKDLHTFFEQLALPDSVGTDCRPDDALMALFYLAGFENMDARKLLGSWEPGIEGSSRA